MNELATALVQSVQVPRLSADIRALFSHRTILRLGLGITTAFTVVFFYELFNNSFIAAGLVYLGIHIGTLVMTPVSARFLRTLGVRSLLILALPAFLFSTVVMVLLTLGSPLLSPVVGAVLFAFGIALYKALYWVPYHVDMAMSLDKEGQGRQLALLNNIADILAVSMPLVGGLILASTGFLTLYVVSFVITILSVVPLFFLTNRFERYEWGYVETFTRLMQPSNRPLLYAHFSDGVQSVVLMTVWPLMIYLLVSEQFDVMGAIATLTLLTVLVIRTVTGVLLDRWHRRYVIFWGSVLSASGWVLKLFVGTPIEIVMVDTYHGFGRVVQQTAFDTMTYEQAADNGRYIDEYTVLKETAIHLGRSIALGVLLVVAYVATMTTAFAVALVFAAAGSLTSMYLARRVHI